jgi:rhodanese-related sulfurtransferase
VELVAVVERMRNPFAESAVVRSGQKAIAQSFSHPDTLIPTVVVKNLRFNLPNHPRGRPSNVTASQVTVAELTLAEAWEMLRANRGATLIDVRTGAEWNFVGVPDLTTIGNELRQVEWTTFPDSAANPNFIAQASEGLESDQPILLLCRSGVRSHAAATALTRAGYGSAYNIVAGFEGDLDQDGHRHGGWKDELPWRQG